MNRRLDGPHSRLGRSGEEKPLAPAGIRPLAGPARSQGTFNGYALSVLLCFQRVQQTVRFVPDDVNRSNFRNVCKGVQDSGRSP